MHVLILGGTGIISTGIVRELLSRGHEVTAVHRGPGEPATGLVHVAGDRDSLSDLLRAGERRPVDAVIDMICFRPEQAELAIRAFGGRVRQYVFCSTVDVYRKTVDSYPLREDAPRDPSPTFPYAYAKAACERAFESAAGQGAFDLTTIRPAATYADQAVAPMGSYQLYVERLRAGLPIVLHGDGSAIWTVAHRDDVALAFAGALGNPDAVGRAFTVAGEELLTWNSYWRIAAAAIGAPEPRFVHIPTSVLARLSPARAEWCVENFQYDNIFDCSAAAAHLGYRPRIGWRAGAQGLRTGFPSPVDADLKADFEELLAAWERMINSAVPVAERVRVE